MTYIELITGIDDYHEKPIGQLVNEAWFQMRAGGTLVAFKGHHINGGLSNLEAILIKDCCEETLCLSTNASNPVACFNCNAYVNDVKTVELMELGNIFTRKLKPKDESLDLLMPFYSKLDAFDSIMCADEVISLLHKHAIVAAPAMAPAGVSA